MDKKEIKAVQDILSNKKKFRRVMILLVSICATIAIITGVGFYTGAISYHGGVTQGSNK